VLHRHKFEKQTEKLQVRQSKQQWMLFTQDAENEKCDISATTVINLSKSGIFQSLSPVAPVDSHN
jgi:hypothetical protein